MTTSTTGIRTVSGTDLPAPGTWRIDPGHAEVAFVGRHLMLTKVRGRFRDVQGTVVVGDDPAHSRVEVTIDMASVDSGDATRDEHLRSSDLFDVAAHPTATFRSTAVHIDGRDVTVEGTLTIKGVARHVVLRGSYVGGVVDPWGGVRAVFAARTRLDRESWGLTWNVVLEAGGLLVSREVDVEIELEATLEQP